MEGCQRNRLGHHSSLDTTEGRPLLSSSLTYHRHTRTVPWMEDAHRFYYEKVLEMLGKKDERVFLCVRIKVTFPNLSRDKTCRKEDFIRRLIARMGTVTVAIVYDKNRQRKSGIVADNELAKWQLNYYFFHGCKRSFGKKKCLLWQNVFYLYKKKINRIDSFKTILKVFPFESRSFFNPLY